MSRLRNVLVSLDQLGNAIAGGNPDSTISARTGYNARHRETFFWRRLQSIVDWAFFVLDGKGHCWQAFQGDPQEMFFEAKWYDKVLIAVMSLPACLIVGIVTRVWRLFSD